MNAGERRRLYARAGILMVTKGMDPTQAVIEAARQLGLMGAERTIHQPEPQTVNPDEKEHRCRWAPSVARLRPRR